MLQEVKFSCVCGKCHLTIGCQRFFPDRIERPQRFTPHEIQILVGGRLGGNHGNFNRFGHGKKAGRAHRFQADSGMRIGRQAFKQIECVRDPIVPVTKHPRRRGTSMKIGGSEHSFKQRRIDFIVVLMDPQRFEQMVLIARVVFIEPSHPTLDGSDCLFAVAAAQFDLGSVANARFGVFQQVEQLFDWFTGDFGWLRQRPALIGNAIYAAVDPVAARIAEVVLHVADDGIVPIRKVESAVRPDFQVGRTKAWIAG